MLNLRPSCELCGTDLGPASDQARICTYECTFCAPCTTSQLHGICPNCGGELVVRPRRPAGKLVKDPASTVHVRHEHDTAAHQRAVHARLVAGDLPEQLWNVTFINGRSGGVGDGYAETAEEMDLLAAAQPGYAGIESVRTADGTGITVSWWASIAAMVNWRQVAAHRDAQQQGRDRWYAWYRSDVTRVDRTAVFGDRHGG